MNTYIAKADKIECLEGDRISVKHFVRNLAVDRIRKIVQLAGGQWTISVETWKDSQLICIEYLER